MTQPQESAPLPQCQQCGGPLTASNGQTIAFTTTMIVDEQRGAIDHAEAHSGWCGACIEDWNQRIGTQS